MTRIVIEGSPVSVNKLYATFNGHRVLSREGRAYKLKAGWIARKALAGKGENDRTGEFILSIYYYFKTTRGDIDNCTKVILDSFTGIIYDDDQQIKELHVYKKKDAANPRAVVYSYRNEEIDPFSQRG